MREDLPVAALATAHHIHGAIPVEITKDRVLR